MNKRKLLLFLQTLLLCAAARSQVALPTIRLFNTRDGLPDNKVAKILETRNSPFRWAITSNELCRFDGYRFQTVWDRLPEITDFSENSQGTLVLWHLGATQKISFFEPSTGKQTTLPTSKIEGLEGRIVSVWTQDTLIFLVTESVGAGDVQYGIYQLYPDLKTRFLHRVQVTAELRRKSEVPIPLPNCLWDEKNNALWYSGAVIGKPEVFLRYSTSARRIDTFFVKSPLRLPRFPDVIHLKITPNGRIWAFSTGLKFVWAWSEQLQKFEIIYQKPGGNTGLSCLGYDQKGAMIFRKAENGIKDLWMLDTGGNWTDLKPLLPDLNFKSCAGTDFSRQIHFACLEGVLRVNFENPLFKNVTPELPNHISNAFRGIAADRKGRVWAMAEMMGLFRIGATAERHAIRERHSGLEILTNNALNLQTDAQGLLWSARNATAPHNLLRIDPETGLADTFCFQHQSLTTFLVLNNGLLLLAANDGKIAQIALFDPGTRHFQALVKSGESERFKTAPLYFLENEDGKIWVGSSEGLALFDPSVQKFLDFAGDDTTAHDFPVAVIFQENKNELWLGTLGGGLRRLDLKTGAWEVFTMLNGLPSNKIAGILADENRNLWLSTFNGLSFFQPNARLFTNFFVENGLSHNEFNRFSFFRNADGALFFGGLKGVNFFKPSVLLQSFEQGKDSLLISQITFFAPGGKTKIDQILGLENLPTISLPPENRFLSIRLALANFLLPEANRFAWRLEGRDETWHLNGTNNVISFDYLPAGRYRLHIKAANPTGVWGKNERVVEIEVREFWYKTGWAMLFFVAAALGLGYVFYKTQVRRKLEQAENQKIKELDQLKSRLYTNITHEFRTPLTVILGMADEIETHEKDKKSSVSNAAQLIKRNGQNLLRLINQLLDLSKLDSGAMKLNLVRADVIAYLQYLTESFYSMAQERQIRLVFYPETPRVVMDFDEEKLQVIVFNLLSNALKFTDKGGRVVFHAALSEHLEAPTLILKIQDTGKGISPEALPHIFDRFYQADNASTRKTEGTGIGLALARELIELLEGRISVESEPGHGTVFTVVLPVRTVEGTAMHTPEKWNQVIDNQALEKAEPAGAPPDSALVLPSLLIIEDNPDVVGYVAGILKNSYQIETATNGQLGIERAFEMVPDIIISDVMMPEKDGYEVCNTLKNDERTSHIPIILLTAKATQDDKIAGLRVGADAYLQKPFDKAELLVRLEKLVELREKLQERYATNGSNLSKNKLAPLGAAPTLDDLFFEKIRKVVSEKMGDTELGILQLCRATNLSHTQVFRKIKALTGENPTLFIRRMRLEKARELLKTTELNVAEVAYEVGFSDPNYFSRAFSEVFGAPPSAMRN